MDISGPISALVLLNNRFHRMHACLPACLPACLDSVNQSIKRIFHDFGHQHIYDLEELRAAAEEAGWTARAGCTVERAAFRSSAVDMDLASLDDAIHEDESLYADLYCRRAAKQSSHV